MSKNQAATSRSHPEDALGGHPKNVQQPSPAHMSVRDNIDIDEALGNAGPKHKGTPAHVGPQNQPGQERDSLNQSQANRVSRPAPGDAKEVPNGAAKARRATHGSVIHADFSSQAAPNKHKVARIG